MDGRMNYHLTAENAAFTKIRQLEKRVDETDKELDNVEQQVLANTNAFNGHITQISERVETKELSATSVTANNATFTNTEAGNLNANGITATTIGAGTINVDNLENVNVLHGKTVDVDKTIATIGQFVETHTTTANNTTTNSETLNVSTEANLTGQVNIDGNLTFTKDNGLSKLQGNYLEVDAANVVINNNNKEAYALYVPSVDGRALFGGSVAVQDTLTAKNLMVSGETQFGSGFILDNPTLKNITDGGYSTTALDVDSKGKLVKVKLAADVPGASEVLEANATKYTAELNPIIQASGAGGNYVLQVDTNTFLPMVNDGTAVEIPNGDVGNTTTTCIHLDNIYYIKGSEYLKYNFTDKTTAVVAQVDVSKTYKTMPILLGKVLNEDIPVYLCDNKIYSLLDGSELTVSFTFNSIDEVSGVYADRNGKTYKNIASTDTSFNSILEVGQGVLFRVQGEVEDDGSGYAINCPAAVIDTTSNKLKPFNGGQPIDNAESTQFLYRLVKNDAYISTFMGVAYVYKKGDVCSVSYSSTIYNYGYFEGFDYIITTPHIEKELEVSTENVFVAKGIPVEINGKYFVDGRCYDKVVTSYEEFMQFIVDNEKNYEPYPRYFDVLYNRFGSETIPNNAWKTVINALGDNKVKHFYRLIGLRSDMNGDGYFGSGGMTIGGTLGKVRNIQSIFTFEQSFDFFAPTPALNSHLLYENIEFKYVNGFFKSQIVNDLKNCNVLIEGEWNNAQNMVTFEHCEDVYFMARAINSNAGTVSQLRLYGCNGMLFDTNLIGSLQPDIEIKLSNGVTIKCANSNNATQYGPGANAVYISTGRKEITLI